MINTGTKKQQELLEKAIAILECTNNVGSREWDGIFENGLNNTNYVILGLMEKMDYDRAFTGLVIDAQKFMPTKVVSYAYYLRGESQQEDKSVKVNCMIEDLANEVDKVIKYQTPFETMTPEKWEGLYRYYMAPIFEEVC